MLGWGSCLGHQVAQGILPLEQLCHLGGPSLRMKLKDLFPRVHRMRVGHLIGSYKSYGLFAVKGLLLPEIPYATYNRGACTKWHTPEVEKKVSPQAR